MYSSPAPNLATTGYLASTGSAALLGQLWLAVAFLVIGGMLLTLLKLFPRVAVEPVRGPHESAHRFRLTLDGRVLRGRRSGR
jgi:hypothetical protein